MPPPPSWPSSSRAQKGVLSTLFVLRFFQLAASAITGFIYIYLIWHHTNHYCVYYSIRCTLSQLENVKVPYQYILITATGVACFLNVLVSTVYFIAVTEKVVYPAVFVADGIVLALYSVSLKLVFRVRGNPWWCYLYRSLSDTRGSVADRNCVIAYDGKAALGCVIGMTGCVVIFSSIMTLMNCRNPIKKMMGGKGERGSVDALVQDSTKSRNSGTHISVDIDVAAFMSNEHRMEIGIGDPTGVAEDEKPAKPIEPHPAERLRPGGDMEINEISRRQGGELI